MNPLTNMRNVLKLSEQDLKNPNPNAKSWHDMYRDSAWIFVAGFPYTLSEGDIICVFSQYGEVVNINLVRDGKTGKSKGFCFLCYEDQRSTVLAVDNLNGIKIMERTLRVDHVADYKPPKDNEKLDEETLRLYMEGCAPKPLNKPSPVLKEHTIKEERTIKERTIKERTIKAERTIKEERSIKKEVSVKKEHSKRSKSSKHKIKKRRDSSD